MRFFNIVAGLLMLASVAMSQQTTPPAAPPRIGSNEKAQSNTDTSTSKKKESHRIFVIVPAYDVTDAKGAQITPLTPHQKFKMFLQNEYDPFVWITAGVEAGIEQATGGQQSYGQGAAGYFKRFGAAMADSSSGEFFGTYFLPAVLKQDPRYFRMGEGRFGNRLGYAVTRLFVTRTDSGNRQFNASYVGSTLISGGLSNLYYPREDRGFALTMSRAGISVLEAGASAVGKEFWPDIARKMRRKKGAKP